MPDETSVALNHWWRACRRAERERDRAREIGEVLRVLLEESGRRVQIDWRSGQLLIDHRLMG